MNNIVKKQYHKQKSRGQEGFGVFDRECMKLARATKERKLLGWVKNHPSTSLLFHHRFPTSTKNVKNACHPFSSKDFFDTNYVLVHNGHIANSRILKAEHEKLGISYHSVQPDGSFNDSEALLWDVALYLEGKQPELKAYGSIAFICLAIPTDGRKTTRMHFGRNSSPLKMKETDALLLLSSEGKGEMIAPDMLYSYTYKTRKLETKYLEVPSSYPYVQDYNFRSAPAYNASNATPYTAGSYAASHYGDAGNDIWDDGYDDYSRNTWEDEMSIDSKYHYLPDDTDFDYKNIARSRGNGEATPVVSKDGKILNIYQMVADRLESYLELAEGYYGAAYSFLNDDVRDYSRQLDEDRAGGLEDDEDLLLEIDILKGTAVAMYTSPYWNSLSSVDPGSPEAEDASEASLKEAIAKAITYSNSQTKLLR